MPDEPTVSLFEAVLELHANGVAPALDVAGFRRLATQTLGEEPAFVGADQVLAVVFAYYVKEDFGRISRSQVALQDGVFVVRDLHEVDADEVQLAVAALAERFGVAPVPLSNTDIEDIQTAFDDALEAAGRSERAWLSVAGAFESLMVIRTQVVRGILGWSANDSGSRNGTQPAIPTEPRTGTTPRGSVLAELEDAMGEGHVEDEGAADHAISRLDELGAAEIASHSPAILGLAENWVAIAGLDHRAHALFHVLDRADWGELVARLRTEFCDPSGAPDPAKKARLQRLALDDAATTVWADALYLSLWPEDGPDW